jgi:rhodanese-related sulfurtransferase
VHFLNLIRQLLQIIPENPGLLTFTFLSFGGMSLAQSPDGFDEMIDGLYSKTVPEILSNRVLNSNEKVDWVILDARELEEFEVSHLPDAVFVGYNNFSTEKLGALGKDHNIVVYCSVGYRSERIGEKLLLAGYNKVYNLRGGIFDWMNNGNKVVDSSGNEVRRVHGYNRKWSRWLTDCEISYE